MPKERLEPTVEERTEEAPKPTKVTTPEPAALEAPPPILLEAEYTAEEFVLNPGLFGKRPDIVAAAFDFAKVESCTIMRAKEIVDQFAGRKV